MKRQAPSAKRGSRSPPRGRMAIVAIVVLLAGVGVLAWGVRSRYSGSRAAPHTVSTALRSPASISESPVSPEEERLRVAVAARPGAPAPHTELAGALYGQGRFAEAAWEYQEALDAGGSATVPLAATLARLRLVGVAATLLQERLRQRPVPLDARRALAEINLTTGRPEEAAWVLLAGGAEARRSLPALLARGRARLALGDVKGAESVFLACRARAPEDPELCHWLGEAAARSGRPKVARDWWQKGSALAPADLGFTVRIVQSLLEEKTPAGEREAAAILTEPLRRSPEDARLLELSGQLHQRAGRHQDAARDLLRAIAADPSAAEPHRLLADSLAAIGEPAEALRHRGLYYSLRDRPARALREFERFRRIRPDSPDPPLLISQTLVQMQQNERAAAVLAAVLPRFPRETALRENLATLYLMTLSRQEAAETCAAWLRDEPTAARPHWILGRTAQSNQRLDEAISHFETALEREPENPVYLAALGGALSRRASPGDLSRVEPLFERSTARDDDAPEPRIQLGALRLQSGDTARALGEYLRATDLDPIAPAGYNGLVQVAQRLRKPGQVSLWARAMREVQDRKREETRLRREVGAHPADPTRYVALATALIRSGSLARAEGNLEEAVALRPDGYEARSLLARVRAVRSAW